MRKNEHGILLAVGGVGILICSMVVLGADNEALVQVVTVWDGGCNANTASAWDNMTEAWYDEVRDSGAHGGAFSGDGFYHNGSVINSDFADSGLFTWGADDTDDGIDDSDVTMVGLHGVDANGVRWDGSVRINESGTGDCTADQEEIVVGDDDLEFLHFASCESMNEESWWPEWSDSFDGAHQIDGFHGLMCVTTVYNSNYRNFADDAFDIGVADAWVDNLYDSNWPCTGSYDQCPVARGVGTSESNLDSRLGNEEYDNRGNYSDLVNGSIAWHGVVFIAGCDPLDEAPLPAE